MDGGRKPVTKQVMIITTCSANVSYLVPYHYRTSEQRSHLRASTMLTSNKRNLV